MKCERCDGCGKIADSEGGEPWTAWADIPLKSSAAVLSYRFGSVGDAQHMGQDAPLPGDGWVREKDR